MGEQEGNVDQYSSACISNLTPIPRPERTRRDLHRFPRLLGPKPRHRASWTSLHRPQETFLPLHHDQHPLSTFRRHHVKQYRGSGRIWCPMTHNLCHQHPRAMAQDSCSLRFLRADLALKRQRKTFAVDTLTFSNSQPRHHPHHHRRSSHFQ